MVIITRVPLAPRITLSAVLVGSDKIKKKYYRHSAAQSCLTAAWQSQFLLNGAVSTDTAAHIRRDSDICTNNYTLSANGVKIGFSPFPAEGRDTPWPLSFSSLSAAVSPAGFSPAATLPSVSRSLPLSPSLRQPSPSINEFVISRPRS